MPNEHHVYRCFDSTGALLYIGLSSQIGKRLTQHSRTTPWWSQVSELRLTRHATSYEASRAEAIAIVDEGARYNRTDPPPWLVRERTPKEWRPIGVHEVPVSQAKGILSELVQRSNEDDIVLTRHGKPAAVMVGYDRYERLIEDFQDALDRLSVHERDHDTVSFDKVAEELGLD